MKTVTFRIPGRPAAVPAHPPATPGHQARCLAQLGYTQGSSIRPGSDVAAFNEIALLSAARAASAAAATGPGEVSDMRRSASGPSWASTSARAPNTAPVASHNTPVFNAGIDNRALPSTTAVSAP